MKFTATMKLEVADHDVDIIEMFEKAVAERFLGTAIKVVEVTVMPEDPQPEIGLFAEKLRRINEE